MRCSTENKSIGWYFSNQRKLDFEPSYQREGGAWSLSRKQLFIDSLLNDFDIPKIYLHELEPHQPYEFAVIDGKQRITTLISFFDDGFPLAEDFSYEGDGLSTRDYPERGKKFSEFSDTARQHLRDVQLATTIVRRADTEEIESLFSRLNDGEPLNNAETRNAFGGAMVSLVRDLADSEFFTEWLGFPNKRFAFRETACRILFIEAELQAGRMTPDLNKRALDNFVKENRGLSDSQIRKLDKAVRENLAFMTKCFDKKSKELSKQSLPQVYYLWLREARKNYADPDLAKNLRVFIEHFAAKRVLNNKVADDEGKDKTLSEFSYLSGQGTNNAVSMDRRAEILSREFLAAHPETKPRDPRRLFTRDEKFVIWLLADKKCQACSVKIENFSEFDADHIVRYSEGGTTSLENAQALCASCNRSKQ